MVEGTNTKALFGGILEGTFLEDLLHILYLLLAGFGNAYGVGSKLDEIIYIEFFLSFTI